MSAASWRRHVGHGVMMLAVGLLLSNRVAAKMKIRMPRIAVRPAAGSHSKSIDFCGGGGGDGRTRVGRGFQCRRDEEGSWGFRFGTAVCPGGDRGDGGGGFRDLISRDRPHDQEVNHNADAARDAATAMQPASDASRSDVEPPSGAALCDVKRVEYFAEFNRGSRQVARFHVNGHNVRLMMRST